MDAIIELIPPKIAAYLPLNTSGYRYAEFPHLIDFSQPSFWIAAAAIVFNPLYWNVTARNGEYPCALCRPRCILTTQSTATRR